MKLFGRHCGGNSRSYSAGQGSAEDNNNKYAAAEVFDEKKCPLLVASRCTSQQCLVADDALLRVTVVVGLLEQLLTSVKAVLFGQFLLLSDVNNGAGADIDRHWCRAVHWVGAPRVAPRVILITPKWTTRFKYHTIFSSFARRDNSRRRKRRTAVPLYQLRRLRRLL